jgi:hypothetical protein
MEIACPVITILLLFELLNTIPVKSIGIFIILRNSYSGSRDFHIAIE